MLTRCPHASFPHARPNLQGGLVLLFVVSIFTWTGCSGGSSTETSPDAEDAAAQDESAGAGRRAAADPQSDATAQASGEDDVSEPEPAGEAPFDTTFLNADTEVFLFARVGDILESSLVQTLTAGNLGPLDQFRQKLGVSPREIDTVTVGVSQLADLVEKSAASMPRMGPSLMGSPSMRAGQDSEFYGDDYGYDDPDMAMDVETEDDYGDDYGYEDAGSQAGRRSPADSGQGVVVVIRTKSPFNLERIEGTQGVQRVPYGNSAYYRVASTPELDKACLYPYDSTTLIVSDEITIKEVVDQGEERARPTADLGFIKSAPHLLVAVAPKDKAALIEAGSKFPLAAGGLMPPGGFSTGAPSGPNASGSPGGSRNPYSGGPPSGAGYPSSADSPGGSRNPYPGGSPSGAGYPPNAGRPPGTSGSGGYPGAQQGQQQYSGGAPEGYPGGRQGPAASGSEAGASPADETLFEKHMEAFALLVDVSEGIGLNIALKCDTDAAAEQVLAEISTALTDAKTQFEGVKATLPGVIRLVAQPLVDSLDASQAESAVTVSLALPEEQQAMLPMIPAAVMGMVMSGMASSTGAEFSMTPSLSEFAQEIIFEGQPAANPDELPEGMQLKALARWGESPYGDQAPPPLEIGIVAKDGPAAEAVAFGHLKLTEAATDASTSLKWTGTLADSFDKAPVTDLLAIERDGVFSDHPSKGVVTGFVISPPAGPVESLTLVAGEVTLQIAGSVLEATIADVRNVRPTGSGASQLDEIGLSVTIGNQGREEQLEVAYNKSPLVGPIELVGPDGLPLTTVSKASSSAGGRKMLTYSFAGRVPPGTGLRATVYADLQTLAVPFRFENLPMPQPPELTAEQQALLVWTPAEPAAGIDDLTIEAQARWRTLERVIPDRGGFEQGFSNQGFRLGAGPFEGPQGGYDDDSDDYGETMDAEGDYQPDGYPDYSDEQYGRLGARGSRQSGGTRAPGSENPLQIVVDLIGPLARNAEGLGFIEISLAKSNIDTDLAFEGAEFESGSGIGDPTEGFVDINWDMMIGEEHPPGGLRVVLKLTPPNQPIESLARLNASLKFKTVRERAEAIVPNVSSRTGAKISHAGLSKFGIKFYAQVAGNQLKMRLAEGRDDRISKVIPLDLNDRPITDVVATQQAGGVQAQGRTIYVFEFPRGVPEKVGLKFFVNMGIDEVTIPIRISDLPLPPLPPDER